ncbi:MAG: lipase family protein [Thermoleophilia bacterium]
MPDQPAGRVPRFARNNPLFFTMICLFAITLLIFALDVLINDIRSTDRQEALQPFYTPPDPLPQGKPGDVIRREPLDVDVPGARGERILYLTEESDGTRRAASGMIFYPTGAPPAGGRGSVAWAHPTVGMAARYAPSRTDNPVADMSWLNEMIAHGWVVTATDYAGLGTPGVERFLVGRDESRDVLNSVRAARQIPEAGAGVSFAVWGHSQGGHAALFTALDAASYAPELNHVATAVAAPAAQMAALMSEQYDSAIGWIIGPQIAVSWPTVYSNLHNQDVLTAYGLKRYEETAREGLIVAGLEGKLRIDLKQDFFSTNPVTLPSWYDAATRETPMLPAGSRPLFITQGTADEVVIPDTTALYIQNSCAGGVDVTTLWLGGTDHRSAAKVAGPAVIAWLEDRFLNRPTSPSCGQKLPVQPAPQPAAPAQ